MNETVRDYVTVVAGVPRSGTSVAMQMLAAGGLEVLTDAVRQADADNPRGYLEFEPVKQTKEDPSWVRGAVGKAVKMVYRLLYDLPAGYEYRVVFTKRKLEESVASQRRMMERSGREVKDDDARMVELFRRGVQKCEGWLAGRANFRVLFVDYNLLVADPRPYAEQISAFLDGLDVESMVGAVDPSLYRNRK